MNITVSVMRIVGTFSAGSSIAGNIPANHRRSERLVLGAASWLALTCHVTIAADDAVFGQPQVRHGANTDFIWVASPGLKTLYAIHSPATLSMPRRRYEWDW